MAFVRWRSRRCAGLLKDPRDPDLAVQSAELARIVGVIYALVLGETIIDPKASAVLLYPTRPANLVSGLALLLVFSAAAWEYLRLSLNIQRTPYDVKFESGEHHGARFEMLRFGVDLLIAAVYGVLLVRALDLTKGTDSSPSTGP